jgi:radial spoke head protein 3
VSTQIESGELFDFDLEVQPILDVIVGKTLEQALMEVCEEEELAAIRAHHVFTNDNFRKNLKKSGMQNT